MPVEIHWENEAHTVVRMEMIGRWTWEEAYEGSRIGYDMLETVDHTVNIIIDLNKSTGLPMLALTHARNMIAKRHPRTGMTIFVGVNTLFLSLWKIFSSAYSQFANKREFAIARDTDEALQIFASLQDSSVQPS